LQRRFTKLGRIAKLDYNERLIRLGLTYLEIRRKRRDLIKMFKYVKGIDKINFVTPPDFLKTVTSGHLFKYHGDDKIVRAIKQDQPNFRTKSSLNGTICLLRRWRLQVLMGLKT
jgi:hypothetical protein